MAFFFFITVTKKVRTESIRERKQKMPRDVDMHDTEVVQSFSKGEGDAETKLLNFL